MQGRSRAATTTVSSPMDKQTRRPRALPVLLLAAACYAAVLYILRPVHVLSAGDVTNPFPHRLAEWNPDPRHAQRGGEGAVACDVPQCSQVGVDVLGRGGLAADAAVAVAFCIGVVNLFLSGIGGGSIAVLKQAHEHHGLSVDAREMAPAAASRDMFNHREQLAQRGGLAAGIPGEVAGLYELYSRHGSGTLSWRDVVQPLIDIARDGWNASLVLAAMAWVEQDYLWAHQSDWEFLFVNTAKGGVRLVREGDRVTRPNLANTLELIAANGSAAVFYDPDGPIAPHVVRAVRDLGGIMTTEDLAHYAPRVETALSTSYLNHLVYVSHGVLSGLPLVAALNVLDGYGAAPGEDFDAVHTHRLVEAFKHMAAVRLNLGDVVDGDRQGQRDAQERLAPFTTPKWAREVRANISDDHTRPWQDYNPAFQPPEAHGTALFLVVDSDGNAVAYTTTVNLVFGGLVHDKVTGVVVNDEMDDFSIPTARNAFGLEPAVHNYIAPYKRPLLLMLPAIVLEPELGLPRLVIGSAGGSRITTAVLQAIVRVVSHNESLLDTIAHPRIHHQLLPDEVRLESPPPHGLVHALEARGHTVVVGDPMTAMNAVGRENGLWVGVSDWWRKRGGAAAY